MRNKVPPLTVIFWSIKILATTVGETLADYLNTTLGFGLVGTALLFTGVFAVMLVFQLRARAYEPPLYWLVVVLVSVVGTLISDSLVDKLGVPLWTTTTTFAIGLVIVLALWRRREGSLSMESITTRPREGFYWAAVILTFALGTSGGDQLSEAAHFGYALSAIIFGGAIALIAAAHFALKLDGVIAFWLAYILTRPLGASLGDLLAQPHSDGGFGLGTTVTSLAFLAIIAALVLIEMRTRSSLHRRESAAA